MTSAADDDKTAIDPRTAAAAVPGATAAFAATNFTPTAPLERTEIAMPPTQVRPTELGNVLPAGTRLHEFEIASLIGEGGFGIVYLAQDTSLGRRVALKEYMPTSLAARTDAGVQVKSERHRETFEAGRKSFVNEAQLLAQFDHPSLVKVYRFWEANGTAYMVMPFYDGKNLRDTLRERMAATGEPPDEGWLRTLLVPLTEALRVIHGEKCYHRDIAPDNVMMLAGSQRPLLLDFGAARRVIGDMTQALTVILKPGYAPIEQYAEIPGMRQGPWTDVYALAAVVYFAITGKTPPVSVGRMLSDSYQPLAQVAAGRYSQRFLQAIDRALIVRPEQRTPNIDAFREDLGLMEPAGGGADPFASGTQTAPQWPDDATRIAPRTAQPPRADAGLQTLLGGVPSVQTRLPGAPGGPGTLMPPPGPAPAPAADDRTRMAPPAQRTMAATAADAPIRPPGRGAPPPQARSRNDDEAGRGAATADGGGSRRGLVLALGGVAAVALGAGGWWALRPKPAAPTAQAPASSTTPPASTVPSASPAPAATTAAAITPAPPPVVPPPPPAPQPFDALREFEKVVQAQSPGFGVRAEALKVSLSVARKEEIKFRVTSDRDGFLHVLGYGTDGTFALLVPNKLSGPVRLRRGQRYDFPTRDGAYLPVAEPLGATHLLVVVAAEARDFSALGPQPLDPFMLLPSGDAATAALARHGGAQPLLAGSARCPAGAAACSTEYGAAQLRFETVR